MFAQLSAQYSTGKPHLFISRHSHYDHLLYSNISEYDKHVVFTADTMKQDPDTKYLQRAPSAYGRIFVPPTSTLDYTV